MKTYCKKCLKEVEVDIKLHDEIHTLRGEVIVFEKETPYCKDCGVQLDIEEINERNANKILEESEVFSVLCPFE